MMSEKEYLNRIKKLLKCAPAKKKEILRQIRSDIAEALTQGEKLEQVIAQIGTPEEVAQEFNENLSDDERKQAKRVKCFRIAAIIILILVAFGGLAYWSFPKTYAVEDSNIFDRQLVEERAKQIIELVNAEDMEALQPLMTKQMQELFTPEVLHTASDGGIEEKGDFRNWGELYMAEVSQYGKHMVIVECIVVYEKHNLIYRITFDSDMLLSGFYVR